MYYKVTDKESEVYKTLNSILSEFHRIKNENVETLTKCIGIEFEEFVSRDSVFFLTKSIVAIKPKDEQINMNENKDWLEDKEYKGFYKPNGRTKRGREIARFFSMQQHLSINELTDTLEIKLRGHVFIPAVGMYNEILLIHSAESQDLSNIESLEEITSKEYNQLIQEP